MNSTLEKMKKKERLYTYRAYGSYFYNIGVS